MDISRIFKSIFCVFLIVTFMLMIVSAYNQYRISAELAALGDAASSVTTKLALDELVFEDQAGKHAYVVDPAKLGKLENFTYSIAGDNYSFNVELSYRSGSEVMPGPYGGTPPAGVTTVSLVIPTVVYENARLLEGKLKVLVWRW